MKYLVPFVLLFVSSVSAQNMEIFGYRGDTVQVATNFSLTGLVESATDTTDTLGWIHIGRYKRMTIYVDIDTDSTFFAEAVGDSGSWELLFDASYDLPGSRPSNGYWAEDASGPKSLATYTIADTLNAGRKWKTVSTDTIPSTWIRPLLRALPAMKRSGSYKATIIIDLRT